MIASVVRHETAPGGDGLDVAGSSLRVRRSSQRIERYLVMFV
jgi:hypothetical protein